MAVIVRVDFASPRDGIFKRMTGPDTEVSGRADGYIVVCLRLSDARTTTAFTNAMTEEVKLVVVE